MVLYYPVPSMDSYAAELPARSSKKLDMLYEKMLGQNPVLWEILEVIATGL
jgi:hypothetical protein